MMTFLRGEPSAHPVICNTSVNIKKSHIVLKENYQREDQNKTRMKPEHDV